MIRYYFYEIYNWLKPISFTSVFDFQVDSYMEWLFSGRGGDPKKNGFTRILFISKAFKISSKSWDTDLGSMSPYSQLKLNLWT